MSGVEVQVLDRLQRRCADLENQLAQERQRTDARLTDTQQQQIDDVILQYKQRLETAQDEKLAVCLIISVVISCSCVCEE